MPVNHPLTNNYNVAQSCSIRRRQEVALTAAIASAKQGNVEPLTTLIKTEQSKRNQSAKDTYTGYQLYRYADERFASGVLNPEGVPYPTETTTEGVKRFLFCPDQPFVDRVNEAARQFGVVTRLETKHAMIFHYLERDLSFRSLVWVETDLVYGFVTAPNPRGLPGIDMYPAVVMDESDSEAECIHRQLMDEEATLIVAREQLEAELETAARHAREAMAFFHLTNRGQFASDQARAVALKEAQDRVDSSIDIRHAAQAKLSAVRSRIAQITGKAGL